MKATTTAMTILMGKRLQFTRATAESTEIGQNFITRSGSTATFTGDDPHGLTTGDSVLISGLDQAEYNGTVVVTVTSSVAFTFTVSGTPATPSTGIGALLSLVPVSIVPPPVSVSSISRSGDTATVTTATAHQLVTGQFASIAGATQADYNGSFPVTVTSSTAFTYTVARTPTTPATGTITCRFKAHMQRALIKADNNNTADILIGPTTDASFDNIPAGGVYEINSGESKKEDLADWYIKTTATSQVVRVAYI